MPKVVINRRWGGFSLSYEAWKRYAQAQGKECYAVTNQIFQHEIQKDYDGEPLYLYTTDTEDMFTYFIDKPLINGRLSKGTEYYSDWEIARDDPLLVQIVEELGQYASGKYAELHVVEVPDDVSWYIHDYDGMESIEEEHRSWS